MNEIFYCFYKSYIFLYVLFTWSCFISFLLSKINDFLHVLYASNIEYRWMMHFMLKKNVTHNNIMHHEIAFNLTILCHSFVSRSFYYKVAGEKKLLFFWGRSFKWIGIIWKNSLTWFQLVWCLKEMDYKTNDYMVDFKVAISLYSLNPRLRKIFSYSLLKF